MYASSTNSATPRPRQQAGLACDECRRRKLRCDRQEPQCGVCRDTGVVCNRTTTRQPRGPKKGHLRALQSRIVALERRLSDQNIEDHVDEEFTEPQQDNDLYSPPIDQSLDEWLALDSSNAFAQENMTSGSSNSSAEGLVTPPAPLFGGSIGFLSDLMKNDLDHLYFDRAHVFCPILSKRRYFARARQLSLDGSTDAFTCLQYAMSTLAASTSSQFQHVQDELYTFTKLILEGLEVDPLQAKCIQIEQVQAWILLSIYEFMRLNYHRGWMSAGKCFRLAVLMKLHNIDGRDGVAMNPQSTLSLAELEERRRTFWMAYTIDRFLSLLDQSPLTFDQHVISTRLPAPENKFQSDEPIAMPFLSEPQHDNQLDRHSTFTESIRLVSLCGQSLSHQQQSSVEQAHSSFPLAFWDRHQRLDDLLTQSMESMSLHDPCAQVHLNSMPLLIHMTAQASVLMLYKASQTAPWGLEISDYQELATKYEQRASTAAQQMVTFSQVLAQLSYFKIHPFTPVLLYFCADFLRSNSNLDPSFQLQTSLQDALRGLVHVNRMAQDCLGRLETGTPSA